MNSVFISLDQPGKCSLLINIVAVFKAGASIILIVYGFGVMGAVYGLGVGYLVAALFGVVMLGVILYPRIRSLSSNKNNLSNLEGLRILMGFGIPLYFSSILSSSQGQILNLLLALNVSNTIIGNYATAMNFALLITSLINPITQSLYTAFSKLSIERDAILINNLYKQSIKYLSILAIPASMWLSYFSNNIIYLIYGKQFQYASLYLSLYSLVFLMTGMGLYVNGLLLNSQGKTRIGFRLTLINFIVSVFLSMIFILQYGVIGLIVSIIIGQFISNLYALYQVNKNFKYQIIWNDSIKIFFSSIISIIPIYMCYSLFNLNNDLYYFIFGSIMFVISYFIFIPIFGVITSNDLLSIEMFTQKLPILTYFLKYIIIFEKFMLEKSQKIPLINKK